MPDYLGCALKGTDPAIVPAITFVLAWLCSLGTGTSWRVLGACAGDCPRALHPQRLRCLAGVPWPSCSRSRSRWPSTCPATRASKTALTKVSTSSIPPPPPCWAARCGATTPPSCRTPPASPRRLASAASSTTSRPRSRARPFLRPAPHQVTVVLMLATHGLQVLDVLRPQRAPPWLPAHRLWNAGGSGHLLRALCRPSHLDCDLLHPWLWFARTAAPLNVHPCAHTRPHTHACRLQAALSRRTRQPAARSGPAFGASKRPSCRTARRQIKRSTPRLRPA